MSDAERVEGGLLLAAMAAILTLALLLTGCSTTQVAEAAQQTRYEVEIVDSDSYALDLRVVTDTETGQRWLVAFTTEGGVQVENMGRESVTAMSDDDGE